MDKRKEGEGKNSAKNESSGFWFVWLGCSLLRWENGEVERVEKNRAEGMWLEGSTSQQLHFPKRFPVTQ